MSVNDGCTRRNHELFMQKYSDNRSRRYWSHLDAPARLRIFTKLCFYFYRTFGTFWYEPQAMNLVTLARQQNQQIWFFGPKTANAFLLSSQVSSIIDFAWFALQLKE